MKTKQKIIKSQEFLNMRTCPILGKFILCTCSICTKQISISEAVFAILITMNKTCHSAKTMLMA